MELKEKISKKIESHKREIVDLSEKIHIEPELGHKEFKASKLLKEKLEDYGYDVHLGIAGMETAFIAQKGKGKTKIGILAEYDALP
jgi:metal-dependent amidase/aminoacylase/carboxypeptidase family protein